MEFLRYGVMAEDRWGKPQEVPAGFREYLPNVEAGSDNWKGAIWYRRQVNSAFWPEKASLDAGKER